MPWNWIKQGGTARNCDARELLARENVTEEAVTGRNQKEMVSVPHKACEE
jgi:hypothetical protein